MEKSKVYDWQQDNLTLEKQRDVLEKRREYLLQLMPDDINANAGMKDISKVLLILEITLRQMPKLVFSYTRGANIGSKG